MQWIISILNWIEFIQMEILVGISEDILTIHEALLVLQFRTYETFWPLLGDLDFLDAIVLWARFLCKCVPNPDIRPPEIRL